MQFRYESVPLNKVAPYRVFIDATWLHFIQSSRSRPVLMRMGAGGEPSEIRPGTTLSVAEGLKIGWIWLSLLPDDAADNAGVEIQYGTGAFAAPAHPGYIPSPTVVNVEVGTLEQATIMWPGERLRSCSVIVDTSAWGNNDSGSIDYEVSGIERESLWVLQKRGAARGYELTPYIGAHWILDVVIATNPAKVTICKSYLPVVS